MWWSRNREFKSPTLEDATIRFFRNVGNHLSSDLALYPTRTDALATSLRKPKDLQKRKAYQLFALLHDVIIPRRRENRVATVVRSVSLISGLRMAAGAEA